MVGCEKRVGVSHHVHGESSLPYIGEASVELRQLVQEQRVGTTTITDFSTRQGKASRVVASGHYLGPHLVPSSSRLGLQRQVTHGSSKEKNSFSGTINVSLALILSDFGEMN